MTAAKILELVTASKFRPFNSNDYSYFSGVMTDSPMIAEGDDGEYVIIVDGNWIEYVDAEAGDSVRFSLQIV